MTPRRRAALLLGLAALLGGVAASNVARREAALKAALGPVVPVVVARADVPAGGRLSPARLAVRQVPGRYAPRLRYGSPQDVAGLRAAVAIAAASDLTPALVDDGLGRPPVGPPVRPGERVAEIVALGSPLLIVPGGRVDVLVTRERADGSGATSVALADAEVLSAAAARPDSRSGDDAQRVAVSLRVTAREALFLAAAQDFARQLRVLPRAVGDRRRGVAGLRVDSRLRW
jgi:pilus assembly protein CpaB